MNHNGNHTITLAIIAAMCFALACITGLTIADRDPGQVIYFIASVIPAVIAALAANKTAGDARNAAEQAVSQLDEVQTQISNGQTNTREQVAAAVDELRRKINDGQAQ